MAQLFSVLSNIQAHLYLDLSVLSNIQAQLYLELSVLSNIQAHLYLELSVLGEGEDGGRRHDGQLLHRLILVVAVQVPVRHLTTTVR